MRNWAFLTLNILFAIIAAKFYMGHLLLAIKAICVLIVKTKRMLGKNAQIAELCLPQGLPEDFEKEALSLVQKWVWE